MVTMTANPNTILEIRNLKTQFFLDRGVVKAVDGVNLKLERKTTLGLVGESGCGKSVTAMSIMRLVKSPPGKIVDGQILLYRNGHDQVVDIAELNPRGLVIRSIRGGEIAMVFQEPMTSLNPLYTVGAQIAEVVQLHQKVGRKEALTRALEMLHKVHISDPKQRLRQYPHQLSGGMRQRVSSAIAMSCAPRLLIADEPTSNLDDAHCAAALDLLESQAAQCGATLVVATHDARARPRFDKRLELGA